MGVDECGLSAYSLHVLVGLNFLTVTRHSVARIIFGGS